MATMAVHRHLDWRDHVPAYLGGAAAATSLVSIAASQILLGMATAALLADRRRIRWLPVGLPLLLFLGWTLVSLAFSPDPAAGFAQIKKFYVYLMPFVVFSALRTLREVRYVAWGWVLGAGLSGAWGILQYARKYFSTPDYFYYAYSNDRITGFMDHWMTFSGTLMMALMITGALLLFSRDRRGTAWMAAAAVVMSIGLLMAFTRTMWAGTAAGALWLLWMKKKWLIALVPVTAGLVLLANPLSVRQRTLEMIQPQPNTFDATSHRQALRATGWEMIKAHPLVGVGPEQVGPHFMQYLPDSVPQPIPDYWYFQHLHNVYYHYAAERGIPAVLALLWFLGWALFDFLRGLRRLPAGSEARWLLHGAVACLIAIMVSGWGEVNLGDSEVLATFLSVVACGYVVLRDPGTDSGASSH